MATIDELVKRYDTDKAFKAEVDGILKDGKITPAEFITFAKKYDVDVSLADLPEVIKQAKEAGLIK